MRASVIVPVCGDLEQAWRCFVSLAQLADAPSHEIVIVDDGAVGLEGLVERLGGDVRVVSTGGRLGLAAAVNTGASIATGEVLAVLRDTPEVSPAWLSRLIETLDTGVVLAASVSTGMPKGHPVESVAWAISRRCFDAVGRCPPVSDSHVLAALCSEVASVGRVAMSVTSVVTPSAVTPRAPRHDAREGPELTIVLPTLAAAGDRVRGCLRAIAQTTPQTHEVLVLDNGSSPQGYTAPVNAGIRAARGRYLVIMNDDVEPLPGWWPPLRAELDAGASVTFPMTIDGGMRTDFAAWCFALSWATVERFAVEPGEFFDPRFTVWFQDSDLLVRLRDAGLPPVLVPESRIRHAPVPDREHDGSRAGSVDPATGGPRSS